MGERRVVGWRGVRTGDTGDGRTGRYSILRGGEGGREHGWWGIGSGGVVGWRGVRAGNMGGGGAER